MKRSFARAVVAGLSALTVLCSSLPASAIDIGDILKKGALIVEGGAVVTAIAGPINDFINVFWAGAVQVDIFHAQDEDSSGRPDDQPAE